MKSSTIPALLAGSNPDRRVASPGADVRTAPNAVDVLNAARAHVNATLLAEGEALERACMAVKTSGAASPEAATALHWVHAAHARFNAATGELRALNAQADRGNHRRAP